MAAVVDAPLSNRRSRAGGTDFNGLLPTRDPQDKAYALEVPQRGPADFRTVGLAAEDFPALPKFEKVSFVSLDPQTLLGLIERTAFAVSSDAAR